MIKIAICGCCGKMGQRIAYLASQDSDFCVSAAIEVKDHSAVGQQLGQVIGLKGLNVQIIDDPAQIKDVDVLIEFTSPLAAGANLAWAQEHQKTIVIGTTGLDTQQIAKIDQASEKIPVVYSPNMSLGVNLAFKLVKQAAQKLGRDYRADIVEAHHSHKKDAPSGTAKRLAQLIKQSPSFQDDQIKIDSIREGEIVGDHQVRFAGPQDVIVIKHSAKTRDIFAQGALAAAKFIVKQKPGLYDMQDVIDA
ncbi:4-hydroxy-tetrahydrodipicolinate reductase [Candidatus Omnitrophota bacterium]